MSNPKIRETRAVPGHGHQHTLQERIRELTDLEYNPKLPDVNALTLMPIEVTSEPTCDWREVRAAESKPAKKEA